MISEQSIKKLIEDKLSNTETYLVDCSVSATQQIKIEIDHLEGVGIDECVAMSRHIESMLDREEADFELLVSSPGLDQPFKVIQQYHKNIGREVSVVKTSGEKLKGLLSKVDEESILIEFTTKEKIEGKKKKEVVTHLQSIAMSEIKETRIIISFK